MESEKDGQIAGEIEETIEKNDDNTGGEESTSLLPKNRGTRSVRTRVPEIEVHLYRRGKGPIDVFNSSLGGWDQDLLEVRDILDKYGFKSVYAFNTETGRGAAIRFNPRNGRSLLPYTNGSTVFIDGEPKDTLLKPVTKIFLGVAVTTVMIAVFMKESPDLMKKLNISGGKFPPWILACAVIVFTRTRKRTKDFLISRGWLSDARD